MKTFLLALCIILFSFFNALSQTTLTCPTIPANAGPDKLICPVGESVQIGTSPIVNSGATYTWSPIDFLSDPFIVTPVASPGTITTYTLSQYGTNLIQNGDFEQGNTLFTNEYTYWNQTTPFAPGKYFIGTNPSMYNKALQPESNWCSNKDHTPNGVNMLLIDGKIMNPPTPTVIWSQTVNLNNGNYSFSTWLLSIYDRNRSNNQPFIQLRINGVNIGNPFNLSYKNCQWVNMRVDFPYTNSNPSALVQLVDLTSDIAVGNDFAVDDIYLGCPITTDEVVVNICGPTEISSQSYYARNDCLTSGGTTVNYPIIPSTENHFCSYWECGGLSHFFSNVPNTTANEWYVNDILVPSFGSSPSYGNVQITNQGELIHNPNTGTERFFKFQVKNTTFGSQLLSDPTYVYYAGTIGYSNGTGPFTESAGAYKPGYTGIYTIPRGVRSGPNTTYTWSIPNCTVTNIDPSGFTVQIAFSSGLPTSGISGTLNIQNSYCENGTTPITFYYNSTLRNAISESNNISSIYPNPAFNTLNILSNRSKIMSVDIYDLSGILIRRVKTMPIEKLELKVADLKQGIYNCRITTESGIENQKFIIKR